MGRVDEDSSWSVSAENAFNHVLGMDSHIHQSSGGIGRSLTERDVDRINNDMTCGYPLISGIG
jgi:hypothetical protein